MSRRAAILIFAGALVLIDALARFLTGSSPSLVDEQIQTPPASTPAPLDPELREEFASLLYEAAKDARVLVELGETKDRNLFRIRSSQSAMQRSLDDTDAWLERHARDQMDAKAVAAYRDGASLVRTAMVEAQAGFLRLDFDRVARATVSMREGEDRLRDALAHLQR